MNISTALVRLKTRMPNAKAIVRIHASSIRPSLIPLKRRDGVYRMKKASVKPDSKKRKSTSGVEIIKPYPNCPMK